MDERPVGTNTGQWAPSAPLSASRSQEHQVVGKIRAEPSLPRPSAPLIGREVELAAIHDLLLRSDTRLVTITGPGGVGKTRLAVEIAALAVADFDDVAYVELIAVRDPALLLAALADRLGALAEEGDPVDR